MQGKKKENPPFRQADPCERDSRPKSPPVTSPRQEKERLDQKLDEALKETFPASDPISVSR